MTHSSLYRGIVGHRRMKPEHQFTYSTAWAYLDLAEIDDLIDSHWSIGRRRFSPVGFRRSDHFGDNNLSLAQSVRDLVMAETGERIDGSVRILTQLSHFGFYFSPINVYYCFDQQENLTHLVAEVSNTPWNERHCYVLSGSNRVPGTEHQYSHPKTFHVSPFMGMDSTYKWTVSPPTSELALTLRCEREGQDIFAAHLQLKQIPLRNRSVVGSLVRRPIAAVHLIGAIYFQALRLWMKRCQFFPHPAKSAPSIEPTPAESKNSNRYEANEKPESLPNAPTCSPQRSRQTQPTGKEPADVV
ncbi:MAG: DUF1365 domain-containing protein [Pirellulaceae bacterium]